MLWYILIWTLAAVNHGLAIQHTIRVDPKNGKDQQNCWNEPSSSCKTLNYALGGVSQNDTVVQLSSGVINLSTPNTTLTDLSNFTVEGAGIIATTIQCNSSGAGLFFVRMTNVMMANLTISNCSMLQNSTTWNGSAPAQYPSAVTVHNSSYVTIHSVSFNHNNGIGLSLVNTGGLVNIIKSTFDGNYVIEGSYPGGGGLYIEFPFCFPNNFPNSVLSDNHLSSNSHYIISTCYFTNNTAKKITRRRHSTKKSSCNRQTFGHGGGISVFFRGNSTNNTVDIINNGFVNNTAVWGGALFIEFKHHARKNKINVKEHSQFSHNKCNDEESSDITAGGAVQIVYAPYDSITSPSYNSITFSDCSFTNNSAYWGGGVSYVITTEKSQLGTGTNSLHFINCNWQYNVAKFGAAVDLSLYRSLTTGVAQPVEFESCSFISNHVLYNLQVNKFELQGNGIVYANYIAIQFINQIVFNANKGSALVLSASHVGITKGCSVAFIRNHNRRGGAVSLLASSWMIVAENTTVKFIENSADEMGGAVYAEQTNEHNVISEWNCFIQYSDTSIPPNDWSTMIEFQDNNSSHKGHSIYATTIRSCVWGRSYAHVNVNDTKGVFHWKSFKFNGKSGKEKFTRDSEIATAANVFSVANQSAAAVKVSPGEEYHLPFHQSDDEGQNASTIFFIQSDDEEAGKIDNRSVYVYSKIMQVYGDPNSAVNFRITSAGPIPSTITLNVTFDYCSPGYIGYKKDNVTFCKCANDYPYEIPGILECNNSLSQAYIARLYWGGVYSNETTQEFVTATCPQGYCTFNEKSGNRYKTLLPNTRSEIDFCSKQNRNGTICGECIKNYSISSRSNCIKCDYGTTKGIFLFILYECLPTLLFVSAILIFNVNITSGHWNSFIFYFQIVETLNIYALELTDDYAKSKQILIKIHTNAFSIWNLEFFKSIKPEECYINGISNVFQFYLLSYSTLLFPLGLIFIIMGIKNCKYRFIRCNCQYQEDVERPNNIWNKCKQKYNKFSSKWKQWFGETSLIHGFAAFIVLSYTKVALLSLKFFVPGSLYGPGQRGSEVYETRTHLVGTIRYLSSEHVVYLILPFIFLLISVIFPIYLILKPLMRKLFSYYEKEEQCARCDAILCCRMDMGRVDQLLQEFYGSFNNNCQFYAGFFFFYRLAIYATLAFTPSLQMQYCIQQCILVAVLFFHSFWQPYSEKYKLANQTDALIFLNLNCINALSIYNYYSVIEIQDESQPAIDIQLGLLYLPLLYIPFRFAWWFKKKCWKRGKNNEQLPLLGQQPIDPEGDRERLIEQFQNSSPVN